MLTALQQQKLPRLFAVHDLNHDGIIERKDFQEYARRIASNRGWSLDSEEYKQLDARFLDFWRGLEQVADASGDKRVTLHEWYAYWDRILASRGAYDQVAKPIAEMVFHILDRDGDGAITAEEYTVMFDVGGVDPAAAGVAFRRLDRDRDGMLKVDEMMDLLEEFFLSDDPAAPGSSFFGPV